MPIVSSRCLKREGYRGRASVGAFRGAHGTKVDSRRARPPTGMRSAYLQSRQVAHIHRCVPCPDRARWATRERGGATVRGCTSPPHSRRWRRGGGGGPCCGRLGAAERSEAVGSGRWPLAWNGAGTGMHGGTGGRGDSPEGIPQEVGQRQPGPRRAQRRGATHGSHCWADQGEDVLVRGWCTETAAGPSGSPCARATPIQTESEPQQHRRWQRRLSP